MFDCGLSEKDLQIIQSILKNNTSDIEKVAILALGLWAITKIIRILTW